MARRRACLTGRHVANVYGSGRYCGHAVIDDTDQDDSRESERGRPDTCIHREHGQALHNVSRICGPGFVIRCIPESAK